ncbi:unnamed protein product [Lepidochelys olivacea]
MYRTDYYEYSDEYVAPEENTAATDKEYLTYPDWFYEYFGYNDPCSPKPCKNNGECKRNGNHYTCLCPMPYARTRCEKVKNVCERNSCRKGDCLIMLTPPYSQCACRHPYKPPYCNKEYLQLANQTHVKMEASVYSGDSDQNSPASVLNPSEGGSVK